MNSKLYNYQLNNKAMSKPIVMLCFVWTLSITSVISQTISIPDANFEQALIDANQDSDGMVNGVMLQSDAEAVITLALNNKGINSLQGIEYFTNVSGLVCSNNNLSSLDVSSNTSLLYLDCGGNSLLNLDLSSNPVLEQLIVFGNPLTSIDVSNNTALTYFNASFNQFTNLDISNLTNLEKFYCVSNQLTSLDLSNLPNLELVLCYDNALTNLNLDNAVGLKTLQCYNNQLVNLNTNTNINLEKLLCFNNDLTSLDVSNNTLLADFRASRNELTSIDVSNNIALTILSFANNDLSSVNAKNGNNTAITTFDAASNTNLSCIEVDDADYSATNWINIDAETSFSEDCSTLGVDDELFNSVSLYPNPSEGIFYLKGLQESTRIKVYDVHSRLVFQNEIHTNEAIDINDMPVGMYFVNISNASGSTTKKIVIK